VTNVYIAPQSRAQRENTAQAGDSQQLDFFKVALPPCGRGFGRCEGIVEADQVRCITCGCSAPAKPTIFDGFIQSQLRFTEFLHSQG
jgi:hypothetical protein